MLRRCFNAVLLAATGALLLAAPLAAQAEDRIGEREVSIGRPNAPVTIVEFASITCPHCARFNANVFPVLKTRYIDTGKARYVFREVPINPQVDAAGFLIARCAGPDRYLTVTDALFRSQDLLFKGNNLHDYLMAGAKAGGLSEEQMRACISDVSALAAFNARAEHTMQVEKIDSTPTVIVNGRQVTFPPGREMAIGDIDAVIQPLLGAKGAQPRRPVKRKPVH
jgi:protein-disulfide isomerase